jgi:heterogeneous nuclear rnp K-like protein
MSASPPTTQSVKRPLEDASSPSRNDQPEAKRPALDKFVKDEEEIKPPTTDSNGDAALTPAASSDGANGTSKANGEKLNGKDAQGDTVVPDAPENKTAASVTAINVSQTQSNPSASTHDETAWLHVRALISSPEAATVIGKGGENVSKIRSMSGAKCTVSDYQKGAVERILTVIGVVDAVAKVRANLLPILGDHPANTARLSV